MEDNIFTENTFAGTGIPCSAMARSFKQGSREKLFEKALEDVDAADAATIRAIETLEEAKKVYSRFLKKEKRAAMNATLIKWINLCKTEAELADVYMRTQPQSSAQDAANQKLMELKFS